MLLSRLNNANVFDPEFLSENVEVPESVTQIIAGCNTNTILNQLKIAKEYLDHAIDLLTRKPTSHHFLYRIWRSESISGGRIVRAIASIQIFLGNLGKPGTGIIYSQSGFNHQFAPPLMDYITGIGLPQINETPIISLGSALASGKYKLLLIWNFNPASSLPNQNLLRQALIQPDLFTVVLDLFLNDTTQYADLVFPAKCDLESYDVITSYYNPGISQTEAGPCPYPDCISNFEFFQQLANRYDSGLNLYPEPDGEVVFNTCIKLLPEKMQKELQDQGYSLIFDPESVPFSDLCFPTKSQRIQIPPNLLQSQEIITTLQKLPSRHEFRLITPSHVSFLHSQLGSLHPDKMSEFGKVFLAEEDFASIGLQPNDPVEVSNEFGSGQYIAESTPILKAGEILIYSGGSQSNSNFSNVN